MSIWQAILLFIFSSICGIDSSCEEFQTHRPLIAGALTGLALGNLKAGVMAGASMEFIALGWMTIGAAVPPDPALAGITVAILEILGKQNSGVAISIAIPLAVAGQFLQIIEKGTIDIALMHFAEIGIEKGKFSRVTIAHLLAAIPSALRVAIPALIIGYFADASLVQQLLNSIPKQITVGLQISSEFLVIVGYAMILNLLNVKELLPFFFIGFIIITFSDVTIFALTLIAISFAIIYYHITSLILKEDKRRAKKLETKSENIESDIKISKKDLMKVFLRTQIFQVSWNYERLQNLCYCFCIMPILKKLYKKEDELKLAVMANMEYYNSHPFFVSIILGINIAMEEARAAGEKIDERDIAQVKIAMMGPLAGIGDPIFWGTIRPILAAVGAGIAVKGDVSGVIIFFLSINTVRVFMRYNVLMFSYKKGVNIIANIKSFMPRLKNIMTVLAYTIIGGLVAKFTKINIIVILYSYLKGGRLINVTVQRQLDEIMPNLAPLVLTFIVCLALKKKVSPLICMLILMVLGIAGYSFGILGL